MKKFTDTEKWNDAWFRKLPPRLKCLWSFLCDRCDHAGVIEIDWEDASWKIGEAVTAEDLKFFERQVREFEGGRKYHIVKYVEFQFGQLIPTSPLHKRVIQAIKAHGLNGPQKAATPPVATPPPARNGSLEAFDQFWDAYPKKQNRNEASRVFVEVNGATHIDDILTALRWQCQRDDWRRENGRFVPLPETYLYKGSWHDKPVPPSNNPPLRPPTINELSKQKEALLEQISSHNANPQSVFYTTKCTDRDRINLRDLRAKLKEVQQKIAAA